MTDMLFNMVFPSLVIMVSPFPLLIILSIPRGPKDVRMASATALAATMLDDRTAMGFSLSYSRSYISLEVPRGFHAATVEAVEAVEAVEVIEAIEAVDIL